VRDIGAVAAEADAALQELHQGIELVGDLVNATAEVSRGQAQRLAELAQSLQQVAAISRARRRHGPTAAAGATQAEITSMGDLTATSQQLAQLAERLRGALRASRSSSAGRRPESPRHPRRGGLITPAGEREARYGPWSHNPALSGQNARRVSRYGVIRRVDVTLERDLEREAAPELTSR